MMKLKIFNENLAQENAYLLFKNQVAIVIDPGFNGEQIIDFCKQKELQIVAVLLTHGHFDHIKDVSMLAKIFTFDIYISNEDKPFLKNDQFNYASAFGSKFHLPNFMVISLKDNQKIEIEGESFHIIATPGHTKGSICIEYNRYLFTGDTLFYNSVGRTDLYSGNINDMKKSIALLNSKISNDTTIYPGHGEHGKLKVIKEGNPYLK